MLLNQLDWIHRQKRFVTIMVLAGSSLMLESEFLLMPWHVFLSQFLQAQQLDTQQPKLAQEGNLQ